MIVFYRLFRRSVRHSPTLSSFSPSGSSTPSSESDPAKDRAILVWWTAFAFTLFFRPFVELVIHLVLFSTCVFLISTLDGSLSLLIGHIVLRAAGYQGYGPPLLSSLEAGSLGGLAVIPPTTFATVSLITLLGGLESQSTLSRHATFLLELASAIAVTTAACSVGVTIVQSTHLDSGTLDAAHAARAGALGACIVTVPILLAAAFLIHDAQKKPTVRNEPIVPFPDLVENGYSESRGPDAPAPRTLSRPHALARTAAETAAYVVVILCFITVRLLCF